jgi:ABC-type transporter Mla MlaB component
MAAVDPPAAEPAIVLRSPPSARAVVVAIGGHIERGEVTVLCDRIEAILDTGNASTLICDVACLVRPNAAVVDLLARLRVVTRRLHREMRVTNASSYLQELLELCGLSDVLSSSPLTPD